ncbi:MAG: DnaJ domain-containing protein [Armatimonadetes bacterium]|nr:DnaJ domain-containing protein [Armatimonadota bacterium]
MRGNLDYYSLLGVPRDVGSEELKRRYRQLVRQFHPDVALDPEAAHERFIALVEAYRTLSDPVRRRAYDALQATAPPVTQTREVQVQRQIDDWFRHAVHEMEEGDLHGAAAQCRKILALDNRHAAAQALLGDIHAQRNEWDQALTSYSGAVAAAPRNPVYARKLRDAASEGQRVRATEERRRHAAENRRRAVDLLNARHDIGAYTSLVTLAWIGSLLGWATVDPGSAGRLWWPLPLHVSLAAAGAGVGLGFLLGLNHFTPLHHAPHDTPRGQWMALVLGLIGLASFYLAAAVYCVWAAVRERLTPWLSLSLALAMGTVATLTLLSFFAPPPWAGLWRSTALWSGNLVFPALLLGTGAGRLGLRQVG